MIKNKIYMESKFKYVHLYFVEFTKINQKITPVFCVVLVLVLVFWHNINFVNSVISYILLYTIIHAFNFYRVFTYVIKIINLELYYEL